MSVETSEQPHNCPGPESEMAGNSDACQGCPNQQICKTAPKVDPGMIIHTLLLYL